MGSQRVIRNLKGALTLRGAHRKQGRRVEVTDLGWVRNPAMVIAKGKIVWIGPETRLPAEYKNSPTIDSQGAYLYPGFVDAHTHLIFAGDRKNEFELRNQGVSYQEIAERGGGILSTVQATRKASLSQLTQLGQQRVQQMLAQGVTTIEVKSGYGLNPLTEFKILKAARELKGARIVSTFLGAHAIPKEYKNETEYLNSLKRVLEKVKAEKLAKRVDIFVEKGYFSRQGAEDYLQTAKKLGFDLCVHADQMSSMGASLMAAQVGALSADHMIQLSNREKDRLAAFPNMTAVLLPIADFYLQCAYPDARGLLDRGVRVALATDFNPGSSPSQSVALLGVLARLQMKMTLPEVFAALTVGGAFALGMQNQVGALLPGMNADFFFSEKKWDDFFYDMGPHSVLKTFVNGKKVF